MKKIISLLLAVSMVFALAIAVSATPVKDEKDVKDPASYLWLENAAGNDKATQLTYKIDASEFKGKTELRIFGKVKFEDIQSTDSGCAFANIYFYDANGELITVEGVDQGFFDWADSKTDPAPGEWRTWEQTFEVSKMTNLSYVTVGFGFWKATGKLYVGPVNISAKKEMFWTRSFMGSLDVEDEAIDPNGTANIDADNEGITFGTVYPKPDNVGVNLAAKDGVNITIVGKDGKEGKVDDEGYFYNGSIYHASLNDGIIGVDDLVPEWYGFHTGSTAGVAKAGKIDDKSGTLGTIIVDLGENAEEFNRVRIHTWNTKEYGVGVNVACRAYYSNDKKTWTEFGDLISGEEACTWADSEVKDTVKARYVKIDYLYNGTWGMVSEVEVISAKGLVVGDDSSAPESSATTSTDTSTATSTDTSTEKPAPTADNGIVALAVIAAVAAAGAVVVKKVR